jgi:hypothetical protein
MLFYWDREESEDEGSKSASVLDIVETGISAYLKNAHDTNSTIILTAVTIN